jgi:P27 family predicted phage terminase small subunit
MAGNANSGRRKEPATVIQMKGRGPGRDSGGRPIPATPKFNRVPPSAPEWMSEEGLAEWNRVVPGLSVLDILKPEDRAVLAAYCETWSVFVRAQRDVNYEGLHSMQTTTLANGNVIEKPVPNPAVAIARAAGRELRGFAAQFGLTPSSETALGKASDDGGGDENPFA